MKKQWMAAMLTLVMALVACDDTTETVGSSLTDNMDNLKITTDSFVVKTRSVVADSVYSRNTTGYLGRVKDPETGAFITGNFMVQFHTLENFGLNSMPDLDKVASLDAQGEIVADSCDIRLFYTSYYGDSLAAMKISLQEMAEPMREGVKYYSNFDPEAAGMLREDGLREQKVYSLADQNYSDSLRATTSYTPHLRIPLNQPYTDRSGQTYNNYGTYLLRTFYSHPEYFADSYHFINDVCPGFYAQVSEGLGSMAYITTSQLNVFFRYKATVTTDSTVTDTIYSGYTSFAGTEEVLQTTTVKNDQSILAQLAADNSCSYLKTPAGIFTEMTLPVDEITYQHDNDTLSSAKVVLTRLNSTVESDYLLSNAQTLLLVERDSMYNFFEEGKVPDYKQTFLSTNDATVYGNTYTFSNISNLVRYLHEAKEAGLRANPNWLAEHPNWNKVMIVPVSLTTITSNYTTIVAKVSHDMSLTSTRLVGGDANPYGDIRISVIYSKFSDK